MAVLTLGIGFEHAAGHGDHGLEVATLYSATGAKVLNAPPELNNVRALRHDDAGGASSSVGDRYSRQTAARSGGAELQIFADAALGRCCR